MSGVQEVDLGLVEILPGYVLGAFSREGTLRSLRGTLRGTLRGSKAGTMRSATHISTALHQAMIDDAAISQKAEEERGDSIAEVRNAVRRMVFKRRGTGPLKPSPVTDMESLQPKLDHFVSMWTRSMRGSGSTAPSSRKSKPSKKAVLVRSEALCTGEAIPAHVRMRDALAAVELAGACDAALDGAKLRTEVLAARGSKGWKQFTRFAQTPEHKKLRMSLVLNALCMHPEEYVEGSPWFQGPFHYGPDLSGGRAR